MKLAEIAPRMRVLATSQEQSEWARGEKQRISEFMRLTITALEELGRQADTPDEPEKEGQA